MEFRIGDYYIIDNTIQLRIIGIEDRIILCTLQARIDNNKYQIAFAPIDKEVLERENLNFQYNSDYGINWNLVNKMHAKWLLHDYQQYRTMFTIPLRDIIKGVSIVNSGLFLEEFDGYFIGAAFPYRAQPTPEIN